MGLPDLELFRGLPEPYFSDLVARVRATAAERLERGEPAVVDLARGNPEVTPPPHVIQALAHALENPTVHGYPPFGGLPALAEAFADHQRDVFGVALDPVREVVVVPGTKTAIGLCCMALAGRSDAVLMPDPGYPDYPSGIAVAGAARVAVPLDSAAGWAPDYERISTADRERATMMFLNYPSNPTGAAATSAIFEDAVEFARQNDLTVVHDLAYGELQFTGAPRSFLATPGAREVGVELVTMSKTYAMAGWRLGFVAGNAEVIARLRELLDHLTVGVFSAIQLAGVEALRGPQDFVADVRATYAHRAQRIASVLGTTPAAGSYFSWWKLPEPLTTATLLSEAGVALAPGEGFGDTGTGWARISTAVPDDQLEAGLQRIVEHAATHGVTLPGA